jgi:hypothetical protein
VKSPIATFLPPVVTEKREFKPKALLLQPEVVPDPIALQPTAMLRHPVVRPDIA